MVHLGRFSFENSGAGRSALAHGCSPIGSGTYSVEGFALYRERIPEFAMSYPGSVLRKVSIADIRGKTVFDFQLDLKVPKK